jgi:hypothetical protein
MGDVNNMSAPNVNISGPGITGPSTVGQGASDALAALNIYNGVQRGGALGYSGAALSGATLYNNLYGNANGSSVPFVGPAGNVLGIVNGIKQGGVAGYGGAAVNAAQLAGMGGAGYLAAPLAAYNFAKNWKSGATAPDALSGAATGASIGSIIPGVGTLVGGLIGLGAGALSSAFGGGKTSVEQTADRGIDASLAGANNAQRAQAVGSMSPSQSVQYIQGLMNAHDNSPGHSEAIEQVWGKNNSAGFISDMTTQINSAIAKNPSLKGLSASQMYSQVVAPWLKTKGATINAGTKDVKGNPEGQNLIDAVTNIIGQWQSGQLTSSTKVGVGGQTIAGIQAYGGAQPPQVPTPTTPTTPTLPAWITAGYGGARRLH